MIRIRMEEPGKKSFLSQFYSNKFYAQKNNFNVIYYLK